VSDARRDLTAHTCIHIFTYSHTAYASSRLTCALASGARWRPRGSRTQGPKDGKRRGQQLITLWQMWFIQHCAKLHLSDTSKATEMSERSMKTGQKLIDIWHFMPWWAQCDPFHPPPSGETILECFVVLMKLMMHSSGIMNKYDKSK